MRTGTDFDGFSWDIELNETTRVVSIHRSAYAGVTDSHQAARHLVAVGEWNGEALELRTLVAQPRCGAPFNAKRHLPCISAILYTSAQGR